MLPVVSRPSARRRLAAAAVGLLVLVPTVTGCGLGTAGGYVPGGTLAGPLADVDPLDGARHRGRLEELLREHPARQDGADPAQVRRRERRRPDQHPGQRVRPPGAPRGPDRRHVGVHRHRLDHLPGPRQADQVRAGAVRRGPQGGPRAERPGLAAPGADEQHLRLRDHPGDGEEVRHHQAVRDREGPGQGPDVLRGVRVRQPPRRPRGHAQDVRRAARAAGRGAEREPPDLPDRRRLRRHRVGGVHVRRGLHHRRPDRVAGPERPRGRPRVLPEVQRLVRGAPGRRSTSTRRSRTSSRR